MKRKTLRDYILKGGIKGRYFKHKTISQDWIYSVNNLKAIYPHNQIIVLDFTPYCNDKSNLYTDSLLVHLNDTKATSKEIKRAKESNLVLKTK